MHPFGGWIGGIVGGVVGATLWAAIGYFSGYEVGYVAWAIGLLVGGGVYYGNGKRVSSLAGGAAIAIACLAIVVGKLASTQLAVDKRIEQDVVALHQSQFSLDDDEVVVSYIADELIYEAQGEGVDVRWPAGVDPEMAASASDYPSEYWAQADAIWSEMSSSERTEYREHLVASRSAWVDSLRAEAKRSEFLASFEPIDLLFFGLAIVTAFKLAASPRIPRGVHSEPSP